MKYLILSLLFSNNLYASNFSQFFSGASSGGKTLKFQEFTTVGTSTWVRPAGVDVVNVECWGGGGGGSAGRGTASCNTTSNTGGGGGGSGTYAERKDIPVTGNVTVTIGSGGPGGVGETTGSAVGARGNDGGNSSFGALLVAKGGAGSASATGAGVTGFSMRMATAKGGDSGGRIATMSGCSAGSMAYAYKASAVPIPESGEPGSSGTITTASSCCYVDGYQYSGSTGGGGAAGKGDGGNGGNIVSGALGAGTDGGVAAGGGGGAGKNGVGAGNNGNGGAGGPGYCRVTWWE